MLIKDTKCIKGKTIPYVDEVKYLGVTISKGLKFSSHIKNVTRKAHKKILWFYQAIKKSWGPRPRLLIYLYKQIILPAVLYASFAWAHLINLTQEKNFRKLNSKAMRIIAPMHKGTPTAGLEVILGVEPIQVTARYRSISTILRIGKPTHNWDGITKYADGKTNPKRKGFYKHWADEAKQRIQGIEMSKIEKCFPYFN